MTLEEVAAEIAHMLPNRLAIRYFLSIDASRGHYLHAEILYAEMSSPRHARLVHVGVGIYHGSEMKLGTLTIRRPNQTAFSPLEPQVTAQLEEWQKRTNSELYRWNQPEPFVGVIHYADGEVHVSTEAHVAPWLMYTGILTERLQNYRLSVAHAHRTGVILDGKPILLEHINRLVTRFSAFASQSANTMLANL